MGKAFLGEIKQNWFLIKVWGVLPFISTWSVFFLFSAVSLLTTLAPFVNCAVHSAVFFCKPKWNIQEAGSLISLITSDELCATQLVFLWKLRRPLEKLGAWPKSPIFLRFNYIPCGDISYQYGGQLRCSIPWYKTGIHPDTTCPKEYWNLNSLFWAWSIVLTTNQHL